MQLKLKVKPEDFVVEEVTCLPLSKRGGFGVYLLEKKGWNTIDLLLELSRQLKIPFKYFSYGGRKDRYGLTRQYISIQGTRHPDLKEKNYTLKFVGFMDRPMGPDLIQENKFAVTVRKLGRLDMDKALPQMEAVNSIGYPNYFDDQRFGSFDPRGGFLAEKLLKKEFNGALKIYLTAVSLEDKKEQRQRKGLFFGNWRNWQACRKMARTKSEIMAFDFLIQKPTGFLQLLKEIPRHELSTYISSYQSYLWNEILRRLIKQEFRGPFKSYAGSAGEYIFYTHMDAKLCGYFKNLNIAVPGPKAVIEDTWVKNIYAQVLENNKIKNSMFNKIKLRQAFFKSFARAALVKPKDLSFDFRDDEVYPGSKKLKLRFCLPRGSFATMLVKRIFSRFAIEKSGVQQ